MNSKSAIRLILIGLVAIGIVACGPGKDEPASPAPIVERTDSDPGDSGEGTVDDPANEESTGGARTRPGAQALDLAAIATQLGVSEEALQSALEDRTQGRPDFAAVAQELGVTEEALIAALDLPTGELRTEGGQRSNR